LKYVSPSASKEGKTSLTPEGGVLPRIRCVCIWALFFCSLFRGWGGAFAQSYFLCPINPGKTAYMNGTFGELRSDHFHAGLDFRTEMRTGLPVLAAADAYVFKVSVSAAGYGNVVFLRHPNGMTTVYAHLDKFYPALAEFVRKKQYEQQTFEVEIEPDSTFRLKRGDTLGLSGNSGSSGGPHLHFEIRDRNGWYINPMDVGFKEITDTQSPVFQSLALRTLGTDGRINGEFGVFDFAVQKLSESEYILPQTVQVQGTLGLETLVFDRSEGSFGRNGVTCLELWVDGREVYSHHLQTFPYEKTRHINLFMDYERERTKGIRYQRCYIEDGNQLPVYQGHKQKGKLQFTDNQLHRIEIRIFDPYQNTARLKFFLQNTAFIPLLTAKGAGMPAIRYNLSDNTLIIRVKNAGSGTAELFLPKNRQAIVADYFRNGETVFLWDLRNGLPDSVAVNGRSKTFIFRKTILPGQNETFRTDSLAVIFSPKTLFDTLHLETLQNHDTLLISRPVIPLLGEMQVRFIPQKPPSDKARTGICILHGRQTAWKGGNWHGDTLLFSTRELGTFILKTDTTAPVLNWRGKATATFVACTVSDNLSGIESFKATLNGEWLLMNYDPKYNKIWTETGSTTDKLLKGTLKVEVKDRAGNISVLEKEL
jgi:hypothetical protein